MGRSSHPSLIIIYENAFLNNKKGKSDDLQGAMAEQRMEYLLKAKKGSFPF
jgi:hypothetical protein